MARLNDEQFTEYFLKEMFRRVGLKYPNKRFTSDKRWYTKRSWTEAEEESFRAWMMAKYKKRWPYLTLRYIKSSIGYFLLMWGWSIKK